MSTYDLVLFYQETIKRDRINQLIKDCAIDEQYANDIVCREVALRAKISRSWGYVRKREKAKLGAILKEIYNLTQEAI